MKIAGYSSVSAWHGMDVGSAVYRCGFRTALWVGE